MYLEYRTFLTTLDIDFTGSVVVCDENHEINPVRLGKGGLAILLRKNFLSRVELPFHSDRIMKVRLDSPGANPVLIINAYWPTTNLPICEYSNCIHDLHILIEWISDLGTLTICGDFNGQFLV